MILKGVGCSLILVAATAGGYVMASKFSGRVKHLRQFIEGLHMLESDILFTSTPLPEALQKVAERQDEPASQVFSIASQIISSCMGFTAGEAWSIALDDTSHLLYLTGEDIDILKNFGNTLGATDKENQKKHFRLATVQLESQLRKAEEDRQKHERMYKNLGFLFGATLILLLI